MSTPDDKSGKKIKENLGHEVSLEASLSLLKATLESTADGIMVVNREGKIISYNQKFRKMWRIPSRVMKNNDDEEAIKCVMKQVKDPQGFINGLTQLYANPESECFDEIDFSDGRIYERYSIPQRLGNEIVGRVFSFRDVTERKQMEEQLIYQAAYDALTGLPNRVLLTDRISQDIKYSKRTKTKVAVLFFDLDRFKLVNDSLGHNMGDSLLQAVSKRLRDCIREGDTLARWGGDEFIIVVPSLKIEEKVIPLIHKSLLALEEVFMIDNHSISITSSVGVSFFPRDGDDPTLLLKNADAAMYYAKADGRNNYRFYTPQMNERAVEQLEMESDLHKALENNQFFLVYQPVVDLRTGNIVCVEALLRWQHPQRGLVSPLEFIHIIEETGLIHPIGEWVLKTACAQNKAWQDLKLPPIKVSVNVSGLQFKQKNVTEIVARVLKQTGLAPQYLDLELTESSIMENTHAFLNVMNDLKDIGVGLVIDDFGTGYSSLSYLKRFPVDKLKIDQSFIRDINVDEDDRAIAQAIIAMAQKLKLLVVAEGVETLDQLTFLQNNNCDEVQGYYFSRPTTPDICEKLLREQSLKVLLENPERLKGQGPILVTSSIMRKDKEDKIDEHSS